VLILEVFVCKNDIVSHTNLLVFVPILVCCSEYRLRCELRSINLVHSSHILNELAN